MMFPSGWRRQLLIIFSVSTICVSINRPVYKIILNSKGYAQFIQYDVNLPSLREFTICVWVRVSSVESDQSIFTYVGADDKRIMRLWLQEGGRQMRISLDHDRVTSVANVEFQAGAWRDVCLSYQADHGAWALYIDAKLLLCEGSPKLRGYEFPGEGSLIFGYGTSAKGFPTGLSGEIYGASMILLSSIERNSNMDLESKKLLKLVRKNKLIDQNNQANQYIIIGDLQTDEVQTTKPLTITKEYDIFSSDLKRHKGLNSMTQINKYSLHDVAYKDDYTIDTGTHSNKKHNNKFIKQLNKEASLKIHRDSKKELTGSSTRDLPIVLEYETPPPITASTTDYSARTSENRHTSNPMQHNDIVISDVDIPPPPEHNPKVYGQWTSSKFASNVLNYLKRIDFNRNKKQKNVLPTFNRGKFSDSYPYPSEFTYDIVRPPINYKKRKYNKDMHHSIIKRNIKGQEINVQIIEPDENNKEPFKLLNPKLVEVTNRGEAKKGFKTNFHRSAEDNTSYGSGETNISHNLFKTRPLDNTLNIFERHRGSNLLDILPFLKSREYFVNNPHNQTKSIENHRLYADNHKQYNTNIHTPQSNPKNTIDISHRNLSIRTKSKPGLHKKHQVNNVDSIMIGRALAKEVSNQAKQNIYNVPLMKFKHGVMPSYDHKMSTSNIITDKVINDYDDKETETNNNFNKKVKLGNALNEQFIIGFDEHRIKDTFLGGDDEIPDINRHQSKWDSKSENIPASLEIRVCKNIELYVHDDESIGKSKINSPIQRRNIGSEFIDQSYKKCSMKDSSFKGSSYIVIDWIKTPVKLFGGAYVKKTKDLCGFF